MPFNGNVAAGRVAEARDIALDGCLDGAVLEDIVAVWAKGAIDKGQVLAVAQRLLARDVAADECQAATVPGKVLAIDLTFSQSQSASLLFKSAFFISTFLLYWKA